ncbi:hypothetical protein F8388_019142 [Cannabis sativa]|uniref:Ubiquitin-like protease family profile domain-containing protein n=1 Tax=Cannabis sativa TaxID=3483 RepID=A0A7J6EBC0_CANSA|nr:hypothetical protein F8388_019142 [Cannabis sativa]
MFQEQYSWRGSCGAPSRSNSGEQYQDARGQLIEGCVYVPQPPTSYYVPDPPLEPPPVPERRKCRLAIQSRDNIVALGFHLNTRPNDFNVDMGDIDCHVTIQHPIQGAAPLPYPMVDMDVCVVSQATGVVMAWPKHLVIFHDWTDQDALITKSRHSATPLTQQQQEPTRRIREPLSQEVQQPVIRGHNLNEVYKIISTWPDKANVKVSIERHIFDLDMSGLYILKEDILDFIFNKKIGQGIITCYMRILYQWLVQHNRQQLFQFVNPNEVATRFTSLDARVSSLYRRIKKISNNQQYIVTPWIDGEHWMLILLVPDSYWLCLMDSKNSHLSNRPDIREKVILAFQTYYRATRKEIPPKLKVRRPTCPYQLEDTECGYYVMKMMKDLIQASNRKHFLAELSDAKYIKEEIDEVKEHWASEMLSYN